MKATGEKLDKSKIPIFWCFFFILSFNSLPIVVLDGFIELDNNLLSQQILQYLKNPYRGKTL